MAIAPAAPTDAPLRLPGVTGAAPRGAADGGAAPRAVADGGLPRVPAPPGEARVPRHHRRRPKGGSPGPGEGMESKG